MDLPEKGAHCTLATCQVFDLLPIKCPACEALYCKTHGQRDAHGCTAAVAPPPTSSTERVVCQVDECDRPALFNAGTSTAGEEGWSCEACRGAYCISHRHADAHNCVPISSAPSSEDKKAEAQALLSKLFPDVKPKPGSSSGARSKPTDPVKAAKVRAIELMRMKHKAIPGDPAHARGSTVPVANKVHLRVVYVPSTTKIEKVLWFVKSVVTGKAVDLAAKALGVSRQDGLAITFVRGRETDAPVELRNDLELGAQVEDGEEVQLVKAG